MKFKQVLSAVYADAVQIFRRDALLIVVFFLCTEFVQRLLLAIKEGSGGDNNIMIITTSVGMTVGLSESLLLCMLIPLRVLQKLGREDENTTLMDYLRKYTLPLSLEGVRAFAHILLWLAPLSLSLLLFVLSKESPMLLYAALASIPLLAIPAFIKFLRYSFVPYVVLEDKRYDAGELDALKQSESLIKGMTFLLLGVFVLFGLLIGLPKSISQDSYGFFNAPYIAVPVWFFCLSMTLFMNVLLFHIYLLKRSAVPATENRIEK